MTQFEYDLAEFVIHNREEIKEFLKEESKHLYICQDTFGDFPEVFTDTVEAYQRSKLIDYLAQHFPDSFESICLIVDKDFVNITLY